MYNMIKMMYRFIPGGLHPKGRSWPSSGLKSFIWVPVTWLLQVNAEAQTAVGDWNGGLQKTLGVILSLGFVAGCVMVIGGFLAAKRDENWKMTVLYGVGVAGAAALMSVLFAAFGQGGAIVQPSWGQ
jgi:Na+-translocating ferredoxin:NAD+ oxidoreductase RnfA subunit